MKPSGRRIVETLVLAATSLALLGHGSNVPTCFAHQSASRTFNVVGTCGAAGVITVTTDPCSVVLTGDDVGVPTSGNLGGTLDDGFQLYGELNSDWKLECSAGPAQPTDAGAPAPGEYTMYCRRRPVISNPDPVLDDIAWCQDDLLPVTPTCDLHACAPVTCSSDQHTAFAAPGCRPTCVANGPNDWIPTPLPPVCHPETCPQCAAGQEVTVPTDADAGTCCGTCQTPPQSCLDGRAQWSSEVTARLPSARGCTVDDDCTIIGVTSRCETTCNQAVAGGQVGALETWAASRGEELCASCVTWPPSCTTNQASTRAVCTNGTCVLTGP
jgi:hypothetical protein